MNSKYRKIVAILALLACGTVLFFELRHFDIENGEMWFWLAISAIAIFMAGLELFSRGQKD